MSEKTGSSEKTGVFDLGTRTVQSSIYHLAKRYKNDALSSELTEEIQVHVFQSPHAFVGIKRGITVNLGNWESVRLDFSLSVPCYPEEAGDAYKFAEAFIDERLEEEVLAVRGVSSAKNQRTIHVEKETVEDVPRPKHMELKYRKESNPKPRRGRPKKVSSAEPPSGGSSDTDMHSAVVEETENFF